MADQRRQQDLGINESHIMGALCYVGILILVPYLLRKDDPFVRFHIKQGLVLLTGTIIALLAVAWIQVIGTMLFLIIMLIDLVALVQALLGHEWHVPIVYELSQKFRI